MHPGTGTAGRGEGRDQASGNVQGHVVPGLILVANRAPIESPGARGTAESRTDPAAEAGKGAGAVGEEGLRESPMTLPTTATSREQERENLTSACSSEDPAAAWGRSPARVVDFTPASTASPCQTDKTSRVGPFRLGLGLVLVVPGYQVSGHRCRINVKSTYFG